MAKKASSGTAQSADYTLNVDRGVHEIIAFDFTAFDANGTEYAYSLRDFDESPTMLQAILAKMAATWPDRAGFKFRYQGPAQEGGVNVITEIL